MIPVMFVDKRSRVRYGVRCVIIMALGGASAGHADSPTSGPPVPIQGAAAAAPSVALPLAPAAAGSSAAGPAAASACLISGDGYLHARLAGSIEATVDWPNSGTHCEGEPRDKPPGVRLSFRRVHGGKTDLLFVFGITGVREGKPTHEAGVNLTIIVQGTSHIFGTPGGSISPGFTASKRAASARSPPMPCAARVRCS
jgi:hypothetical protein